jgi:hypothetical protein
MSDTEKVEKSLRRLTSKNIKYFNNETIERFIAHLDSIPKSESYSHVGDENKQLWSAIKGTGGENSLTDFNKCTLLYLIENFSERTRKSEHKFPESIIDQFHINFQRILTEMDSFDDEHYKPSNDLFLKDLGICRQKLIPVGPRLIELNCGYSRKILLSGGWKQFFKFLYFFIFIERNNNGFYQTHVHLSLVKHFNPEEIHESYLRIAELLIMNPSVKGLFGASWYYDPALVKVSRHLTYLRTQQEDNGAWIFYSEPETSNNPFSKSKSRKKMFEAGKYQPKIYLCIWPRKSILAYSKKNQEK